MGLESKFWNKLGFILILAHFPATWELKIWKFSNFGQNHFSDFETPFLAGLTDLSFVDRLVEDQIVCWLRLHNNANIYYMYMYISDMHSTYNSLALDVLLVIFHHSQRFFSLCLWSRVSLIECFYYNLLIKGPLSYKSYKVVESFKNLENWQKSLLHSLCNNVICISYVACTFSCAYFEFMMPAACIQ